MPEPWDQITLRDYLLGKLSPAEAETLENAYITDDGLFEDLRTAERELVHSYLRNSLPDPLRRDFEAVYLTNPVRRRRLETEREWFEAVRLSAAAAAAQAGFWARWTDWLTAGSAGRRSALVACAAFGLLLLFSVPVALWRRSAAPVPAPSATAVVPPQTVEKVVAVFELIPAATRGSSASTQRLNIPPAAAEVRMRLALGTAAPAPEYRASLNVVGEKKPSWEGKAVLQEGAATVVLPAADLSRNDYVLKLEAAEPVKYPRSALSYSFRVTGTKSQ